MNMNNSYDELAQVFEHLLQDYVYPTVRADLMYHWPPMMNPQKTNSEKVKLSRIHM